MHRAQQSIVECRVSCDKELAGARHAVAVIIRVSLLNLHMMLMVMFSCEDADVFGDFSYENGDVGGDVCL